MTNTEARDMSRTWRLKTMEHSGIPKNMIDAAVSILAQYLPGLTPDRLEKLIAEPVAQQTGTVNYLTRRDVSKRLNISLPTTDRLLASGDLPYCKFGRSVRISENDLCNFITSKKR
jgi:excisionase family DNA binding protein